MDNSMNDQQVASAKPKQVYSESNLLSILIAILEDNEGRLPLAKLASMFQEVTGLAWSEACTLKYRLKAFVQKYNAIFDVSNDQNEKIDFVSLKLKNPLHIDTKNHSQTPKTSSAHSSPEIQNVEMEIVDVEARSPRQHMEIRTPSHEQSNGNGNQAKRLPVQPIEIIDNDEPKSKKTRTDITVQSPNLSSLSTQKPLSTSTPNAGASKASGNHQTISPRNRPPSSGQNKTQISIEHFMQILKGHNDGSPLAKTTKVKELRGELSRTLSALEDVPTFVLECIKLTLEKITDMVQNETNENLKLVVGELLQGLIVLPFVTITPQHQQLASSTYSFLESKIKDPHMLRLFCTIFKLPPPDYNTTDASTENSTPTLYQRKHESIMSMLQKLKQQEDKLREFQNEVSVGEQELSNLHQQLHEHRSRQHMLEVKTKAIKQQLEVLQKSMEQAKVDEEVSNSRYKAFVEQQNEKRQQYAKTKSNIERMKLDLMELEIELKIYQEMSPKMTDQL